MAAAACRLSTSLSASKRPGPRRCSWWSHSRPRRPRGSAVRRRCAESRSRLRRLGLQVIGPITLLIPAALGDPLLLVLTAAAGVAAGGPCVQTAVGSAVAAAVSIALGRRGVDGGQRRPASEASFLCLLTARREQHQDKISARGTWKACSFRGLMEAEECSCRPRSRGFEQALDQRLSGCAGQGSQATPSQVMDGA